MKLEIQVYLAVIAAIIVGGLFFFANHATQELINTHADVLDRIGRLDQKEQDLRIQILEATSHIEYEYDSVQLLSRQLRESVDEILSLNLFAEDKLHHKGSRSLLLEYKEVIVSRENLVQKFNTVNSLIKNSTSQIPTAGSRYLSHFGSEDTDYLYELSRLTSATFQAANSMDIGYSDIIRESLKRLEQLSSKDPQKQRFNQTLLSHAKVFMRYVPLYRPLIQQIEAVPARVLLNKTRVELLKEGEAESTKVSALTLFLAVAFIATIMLVIYFLITLNRDHAKLKYLHQRLQQAARQDTLTGLPSRFAYEHDQKELENGALIVVNLDGFKHFNDFYGTDAGDFILKRVAVMLLNIVEKDSCCRIYRLGGDDFGLLMETTEENVVRERAQSVVNFIGDTSLNIDDYQFTLSARAGCSLEPPLLEKADMALKQAKQGRTQVLLYNDVLGLHQQVENNLRIISMLKRAIERDAVEPYYQPILDLRQKKITRYECLMRITDESGELITPNEFLQVARESNLYADLSRIMIEKSINRFKDEPYGFSINLSIEDILDDDVTGFLFEKLEKYPTLAHRMILEILESEEVENYNGIKQFVREAQSYGCQVAIDDFGSGYSSLRHMLELQVDILKIDETLVRELHQDETLRLLVAAILELANGVGIDTVVAEFVHNRQVLEIVAEQGVHYVQGYYIGKPAPDLVPAEKISFEF